MKRRIYNALTYIKPRQKVIYFFGTSGGYQADPNDWQIIKHAWELYTRGRVTLYQKRIDREEKPPFYQYIAEGRKRDA